MRSLRVLSVTLLVVSGHVKSQAQCDAGQDSTASVCESGAAFSLLQLNGGDPGGVWLDPNNAPHFGVFIPSVSDPGCYVYIIAGGGTCTFPDTAMLCVSVIQAPNAGNNTATAVCSSGAPIPLSGPGVWYDPNGHVTDSIDPSIDPPGTYTYVLLGAPPCAADTMQLWLTINDPPSAGTNAAVSVCSYAPPFSMIDSLGGIPQFGGFWTDPAGPQHSGVFDPATDPAGQYLYTVQGVPPCANDVTALIVNTSSAPDPGTNGNLSISASAGTPTDLFDQLNGTPDVGGTWTDPNGAAFTDPFDPAVHMAGCYTYTVAGTGPCADASATVCVVITPSTTVTPASNYPTY